MHPTFDERRRNLKLDTERRISALQEVMREKGIGAALFAGTAGPGLFGVPKYFTNLSLWYGRAFVVIGATHPEPAIVHWSGFQSEWNRQEATTTWIETPDVAVASSSLEAFKRALAIAAELCGDQHTLGVENISNTWTHGEYEEFKEHFSQYRLIDIFRDIDAIRSIKSPFELSEIKILGELMTKAMERFAAVARPGRPIWHAMSAGEELLKSEGGSWGRAKMSLNYKPATILPPVDRVFQRDDVILLEFDYSGAFGHWYEMTCLFSFEPLSPPLRKKVKDYEEVISIMTEACQPETRVGDLSDIVDQAFNDRGYRVIGMHLPHCHSIGLDECDGPNSSSTPDDLLKENVVLAVHPGSIFEDGTGFAMSDLFRVAPGGAERQSRKTWLHALIDA